MLRESKMQHNTKLIVLNGPKGSGKTYFVEELERRYGNEIFGRRWHNREFNRGVIEMVKRFYGLSESQVKYLSSPEIKDTPREELGGRTWRESAIHMSENVAKPIFGERIFGKVTANSIVGGDINIISGGFFLEVDTLVPYPISFEDVHVIRIYSEGKDFEGDSRSYFKSPFDTHEVENNMGDEFIDNMLEVIKRIIS